MMTNDQRARLAGADSRAKSPVSNLITRIVTAAATIAVLAIAFMLSIAIFAVLLTVALLGGGYVWWKTRALRKRMRERPPGGTVIEGEVIRDDRSPESMHR